MVISNDPGEKIMDFSRIGYRPVNNNNKFTYWKFKLVNSLWLWVCNSCFQGVFGFNFYSRCPAKHFSADYFW
jgi:hypothetical protein